MRRSRRRRASPSQTRSPRPRRRRRQIDAQAALEVAAIQQEVAQLEARRTEILGQANADVERFKKDAEAQGYELLVGAFGSGHAYNMYTFAENFQPESIRLFFAGDGTFWTDLSRFEELGAAKLLKTAGTDASGTTARSDGLTVYAASVGATEMTAHRARYT